MENEAPKYQRSWKNYLIKPKYQLNHAFIVLCAAVISCGVFAQLSMVKVDQLFGAGLTGEDLRREIIYWIVIYFYVAAFIIGALMVVIHVIHSHRVFGSLYAVEKHLEAMLKKENSGPLHMRKHHQVGDVATLLNELAKSIQENQGKV